MKIVINNNGERIPATLEVVDGVMVVSPKEEKVDVTQFKDGDIITCGDKSYSLTCVLRGEIEKNTDFMFIAEYCNVDSDGDYSCENGDFNFATWVRYATEEEKQKLFDVLAKEGKAWDAEKKAVVDLKWEPKIGDTYFRPNFNSCMFMCYKGVCRFDTVLYIKDFVEKGWCFKTKEECETFCEKLNDCISSINP